MTEVERLRHELNEEKQKRVFISTTLLDARLIIRAQKKHIAKLERRYARVKQFKRFRLWRRG